MTSTGIPLEGPLARHKGALAERVDDLFVCCASFEDRTLAAQQNFAESYRVESSIIYVNSELLLREPRTRANLYELIGALAKRSLVTVAEGSLLNASDQLRAIRSAFRPYLEREKKLSSVTIDATTFNREALLVLGGLLAAFSPRPRITAMYVAPQTHGKWLSQGSRQVRNVMGFGGLLDSQKPTALILLTGFEGERALKIIEEHEPLKVFVGVGDPPTSSEFLSRNVSEQQLILSRQEVVIFKFSAGDIDQAYDQVKEIVDKSRDEYNIVIAPMSTKLSTLAVLRLGVEYPEIQITYCVPAEYNVEHYSSGSRMLYVEDIFPEAGTGAGS